MKAPPHRRRGAILYRLFLLIALGVIFLAAGLLLARHFLRPDVLLEQKLYFRPLPVVEDTAFAAWWPEFAERQKANIEQIGWRQVPGLTQYLEVDAASDVPRLTLKVRGPYRVWPAVVERFGTLLASYLLVQSTQPQDVAALQEGAELFQVSKSFPLSSLQKIVAGTFALAGVLLGWAIPVRPEPQRPLLLPTSPDQYRRREAHRRAQTAQQEVLAHDIPGVTIPAARPTDRPTPEHDPQRELLDESQILGQDHAVPVVQIDLENDQPAAAAAAGQGWQPKYDALAEQIDRLRESAQPLRVLVAATGAREASPRFTVNLAIALIRRRMRVLLIETDLDSRDLAELFDVADGAGFARWRHGAISAAEAMHATPLAGLSVMASGRNVGPEAGEVDTADRAIAWEQLAGFDVVLLYAPAALAESPRGPAKSLTGQVHAGLALTRRRREIPVLRERLTQRLSAAQGQPLAIVALTS